MTGQFSCFLDRILTTPCKQCVILKIRTSNKDRRATGIPEKFIRASIADVANQRAKKPCTLLNSYNTIVKQKSLFKLTVGELEWQAVV